MRVPLWSPSLPAVFPHVGHNTSQAGSGTFWPRACRVLGLLPQQSVFRPLPTCARFAHCWRWRAMRARAWQSGLVDAGGRPRDTTRKAAAVTGVRCGGRASDAVDEPWRLRKGTPERDRLRTIQAAIPHTHSICRTLGFCSVASMRCCAAPCDTGAASVLHAKARTSRQAQHRMATILPIQVRDVLRRNVPETAFQRADIVNPLQG